MCTVHRTCFSLFLLQNMLSFSLPKFCFKINYFSLSYRWGDIFNSVCCGDCCFVILSIYCDRVCCQLLSTSFIKGTQSISGAVDMGVIPWSRYKVGNIQIQQINVWCSEVVRAPAHRTVGPRFEFRPGTLGVPSLS